MSHKVSFHRCSVCGLEFNVTDSIRVVNSLRYLLNPFHGPGTQLSKFTHVRCPRCGTEEHDPSIRFLGLPSPRRAIIGLIVIFLVVGVAEVLIDRFW